MKVCCARMDQKELTHPTHEPLTQSQRTKALLLCGLGFVTIVSFWWAVRGTIMYTDFSELHGLWRAALAFILFGLTIGFFGFTASLLHASNLGGLTILLGSASALLFFPWTIATLAASLLAVVAWARYWAMVSEETMSRIRYSLTKSATHGLGSTVTLTVLAVALFYLGYASTTNETNDQFINRATAGASTAVVRVLERQLPGFRADMTVDEFLTQFGQNQLTSVIPDDFVPSQVNESLLPDAERSRIDSLDAEARTAALTQARTALLVPLNINVDGNERMDTVVNALVSQKLRPVLEQYKRYIPPVLAIAVFSALSLLGFFYFWWAVSWAYAWYGLVRLLGWLKVREESATIHRVAISV